jgi:outer membrane protein assembly factor BamB
MRRLSLAVTALVGLTACSTTSSTTAATPSLALAGHTGAVGTDSYAPWPQAGHDARRSGASASPGPRTAALRWTRQLEGNVTPGPVIGPGGTIYAASNGGTLHALDPKTGMDLWTFAPGGGYGIDLSTSPAVLPDGTVVWPGPGGLYALDPHGKLLWKEALSGATSPAVDGDRVVVGSQGGTVESIDVPTHTVQWKVALGEGGYGSVALSPTERHRSYQTAGSTLYALDDGKVVWKQALGDVTEVSPAVGPDGTVVVGSNSPLERAFSPAGSQLWSYDRHAQTYSSPVVTDDGIAYFGDHRAVVTAIEVATGKVVARYQGPTQKPKDGRSIGIWTSPVIDSTHAVYWGSRSGHLHAVDAAGTVLFDLDTGATIDSYPALGDGLLVVGVTDGRLLAVGA